MDVVLNNLRQKGYKRTPAREEILKILTSQPLSAQEVTQLLRETGLKTDPVTVYRNLALLTDLGVVRKTQFAEREAKYELIAGTQHHHHLVCENCGSVEDIPLDEKKLTKQIETKSKFKVKSHNLEFFGLCRKCQ